MTGALLVSISSAASAQTVEFAPFLGWNFGGTFKNVNVPEGAGVNNLDVANSIVFGLVADIPITPQLQIELLAEWQPTHLQAWDPVVGSNQPVIDPLTVAYYHAGVLFQQARKEVKKPHGFLSITGGITNFSGDGADSETRFSFGASFGGKWYFNERFGARLGSRLMITYFPSTSELFCGEGSVCYQIPANTFLPQIDLTGGVIIAF
jgi:hypothetical protein